MLLTGPSQAGKVPQVPVVVVVVVVAAAAAEAFLELKAAAPFLLLELGEVVAEAEAAGRQT